MRKLTAVLAGLIVAMAAALPGAAAEIEDKLVIITSFPKDLTEPFKAAFQKKHPGTAVEVLNKKTTAGVKFIEETSKNNTSDIFWASAPDAFEVLKNDGLLEAYRPDVKGIPDKIGAYPMNDPDGMYLGFAAAGYGIMYNTRYLKAKGLPEPKEWDDLKQAVYHDHVGMSAPSRSGTTHLTVETILQGDGWDQGWRSLKEMAGNFKTITERSFGVPDGVNSGDFGVGIVIDFFGFSSKATGFPVEFVYPTVTTLVPANVAIVKNAPHPNAAKAFVDFLLSTEGQEILLDPKIRRLPINPDTYAKAPADFPNPFKDSSIGAAVRFDVEEVGATLQLGQRAVRPAHHLPTRRPARRHQGGAGCRGGIGEEAQRRGREAGSGGARSDRRDAGERGGVHGFVLRRDLRKEAQEEGRRGADASGAGGGEMGCLRLEELRGGRGKGEGRSRDGEIA